MRWEHFDHGADIGVRGIGRTPAQAFEQAALALTAVVTEPDGVRLQETRRLECKASDLEALFYEWMNSVIFEMSAERLLFGYFAVDIDDHHLTATLKGEVAAPARHQPTVEVKGATYTELSVAQRSDGLWYAQCIVDV
jgi:tRNA nucleotidyltransferase (CCA-adding enzyme)